LIAILSTVFASVFLLSLIALGMWKNRMHRTREDEGLSLVHATFNSLSSCSLDSSSDELVQDQSDNNSSAL
jgi:hypothetical protein